ncbi:alpha/beta hydrolase family protein [Pontibacter sp. MBLB2868]|uniref:alpha/beta hydrolase family protein n=1 Tax=Pontibacter sp. MBLB2868 TaxID=3451555 RepID=UPI003F74DC42
MKSIYTTLLLSLTFLGTLSAQNDPKPKLVSWQEIAAMPQPGTGHLIKYGPDSLQYGALRLPEGKGPFPVIVVIHGGCWLSAYNSEYMSHVSEALTKAGYATWNIEFRRVGDVGGGFPGTFLDVAKGTDYVRELAKMYPVNARKVIVMGHSAGGHLALWLAARKNLSPGSELYTRRPLKLKGVVSLAGIPDLESYSLDKGSCNAAVPQLMGGMPEDLPAKYAAASPIKLLPLQVPQRLIQGDLDPIVPVSQSQQYTKAAQNKDDDARMILVENAGHFDLVAPQTEAWITIMKTVRELLPVKKN